MRDNDFIEPAIELTTMRAQEPHQTNEVDGNHETHASSVDGAINISDNQVNEARLAEYEEQPPEPEVPERYSSMRKPVWIGLIITILSTIFLFTFDLVVAAVIQAAAARQLNNLILLPWIGVAYAVGAASSSLFWGRVFNLFNIRTTLLVTDFLFLAGTAISGAAPTIRILIVGRAISGIGAAGLYIGGVTILSIVTTIKTRPLYLGMLSLAYGLASLLASILGGVFSDSSATWRWSFYLPLIFGAICTPFYFYYFPNNNLAPRGMTRTSKIFELDLVGNILWTGGVVSLTMGISFAGSYYAWDSNQTIAFFTSAVLIWGFFAAQQRYMVCTSFRDRVLPCELLAKLEYTILFLQAMFSQGAHLVPYYLIPLYFQLVKGESALQSSLHIIPMALSRCVFVIVCGLFMRRLGYTWPWFFVGALFCVAGAAPFVQFTPTTSSAEIYGLSAILGTGVGLYNTAGFAASQARCDQIQVPKVVALISAGQILGATLVLAISNCIFLNVALRGAAKVLPGLSTEEITAALLAGDQGDLALSPGQSAAVQGAVTDALNAAWWPVLVCCALSVVLSLFMKKNVPYAWR